MIVQFVSGKSVLSMTVKIVPMSIVNVMENVKRKVNK